jgi:hypothetical protein
MIRCAGRSPLLDVRPRRVISVSRPAHVQRPTPDGIPTGACSNDPALACDVAANCAKVRMSRSEPQCLADGGTSAGAGSVCTATCSPSGAFLEPIAF